MNNTCSKRTECTEWCHDMHNKLDELQENGMTDKRSYILISDNVTRHAFDIIIGKCNEDDCFTK